MQVFGQNWAFRFSVTTKQAAENLGKKIKLIKLGWIPNDSPAKISNNYT